MKNIKAYVVIGSGYGDEGKGLMTDYYANQNPGAIVVRFNGGAQAGHTVTTPDKKRHVFSHFSSGTFAGNPTYLSEFFVANPMLFMKEHKLFDKQFGIKPKIYISPYTELTTPYDMFFNQIIEEHRGVARHGSCGVGFGETLERIKRMGLGLTVGYAKMLSPSEFKKEIKTIRDVYTTSRLQEVVGSVKSSGIMENEQLIDDFMEALEYMLDFSTVGVPYPEAGTFIFEGAQGLLLDQDYGYFPYVTRSNTGMKNVADILRGYEENTEMRADVTVNYVTRAYTTRHGAGPLALEDQPMGFAVIDETNKPNPWQGTLRTAPLNFDLFRSVTAKDFANCAPIGSKRVNTITCVDQLDARRPGVFINGEMVFMNDDVFVNDWVPSNFDIVSRGPTRDDVTPLKGV